jgi:transcriptional regulator with XRE-family HTH domain
VSHRLHVANLRAAAARIGDTTDGKIVRRTGLGKATISRIVNGNATPAIATLMRLSRVYDIPVEDLLLDLDQIARAS